MGANEIRFVHNLQGVDWGALKASLAVNAFDNGRTADELRRSFEHSHAVVLAWTGQRVVGTARILADGVCNAYLVDVWTDASHRRRGIGTAMVRALLDTVPGHHVALFTQEHVEFYRSLGFEKENTACRSWSGCGSDATRPSPL
jgi:ribosomal protein S18 acetylase RimI-like enzyme